VKTTEEQRAKWAAWCAEMEQSAGATFQSAQMAHDISDLLADFAELEGEVARLRGEVARAEMCASCDVEPCNVVQDFGGFPVGGECPGYTPKPPRK
jgi:hypothetical protein